MTFWKNVGIFVVFLFTLLLLQKFVASPAFACIGNGGYGCDITNAAGGNVCCGGLTCVCLADLCPAAGNQCQPISKWTPPNYTDLSGKYFSCNSNGKTSNIFTWNGPLIYYNIGGHPINEYCPDFGNYVCSTSQGCVTPTPVPATSGTCTDAGGFCTSLLSDCLNNGDTAGDGPTYNCSNTYCCLPKTCNQLGGTCTSLIRSCSNSTVFDGPSTGCTTTYCCVPNPTPTPVPPAPACSTGTTCGTCSTTQPNTCSNNGGQACVYTQNQTCSYSYFSKVCSVPNCSNNYTCSGAGNCVTNIYVYVYTDYNHNGSQDGADTGKQGVTISDNGGNTPTTDSTGLVTFSSKVTGTYNITMDTTNTFEVSNGGAAGPIGPTTYTQTVKLTSSAGNQTVNFYETPLYTISGYVFNDKNKNHKFDTPCTNPDPTKCDVGINNETVTISGNGVNSTFTTANDANGVPGYYTFTNLESGTYTVTYSTPLAAGYSYQTNSAWSVTVGDPAGSPACSKSTSPDATCGGQNNGSIAALNFGVTDENSHFQTACTDLRVDNNGGGTVSDLLPGAGTTCGGVDSSNAIISNATCSTGSGIVYSCNGTFDFGLGSANTSNWQAGGSTQECYAPPGINSIRTSYDFLYATAQQSGITPIDMNDPTVCGVGGIADCTLDANLPKGVYIANGNLALNAATLPAPADPTTDYSAYIFLVNGTLTINGNILVPQGSTALFSASGNVEVAATVGQDATNTTLSSVNDPNLEGIYSADNSFIIHSVSETNGGQVCNADGSPIDTKLNIVGVVIDNAAQTGGQFINNRDLCTSDLQCPSLSTGDGLNYLLTLMADGQFVLHRNFNWQELKP